MTPVEGLALALSIIAIARPTQHISQTTVSASTGLSQISIDVANGADLDIGPAAELGTIMGAVEISGSAFHIEAQWAPPAGLSSILPAGLAASTITGGATLRISNASGFIARFVFLQMIR